MADTCHLTPGTLLRRYARHVVLPQIGEAGQARLAQSRVLVIGAGGLGANVAGMLAAAGVGRLVLCDHDRVELSNLNRQILYETADIGQFKVEAARVRIEEINPECEVTAHREKFHPSMLEGCGIAVDGSDNFETRLAVNAACVAAGKTLVSAAISGFSAQASTFKAHLGEPHPCYQCFVPAAPERERNCAQEGILGPLAGMMANVQAMEAIKELLGIGESLSGRLLRFDALSARWHEAALKRDPACAICAQKG